jgi:hypothetical protein
VASLFARKAPLDRDTVAIDTTVPRPSFLPQGNSIANAALAQALPREEADGNFGLVQPTAVFGSVVHGKPIPQPIACLYPEVFDDRLASM